MDRAFKIKTANENLDIFKERRYLDYDIGQELDYSLSNTTQHSELFDVRLTGLKKTNYYLKTLTTLEGAEFLGAGCAVMNFASAREPGGGFLKGKGTQEESLSWRTTIYHSIKDLPMYEDNKNRGGAVYLDWMAYSPMVVVIRDDSFNLCKPWIINVISVPAVNKKKMGKKEKEAYNVLFRHRGFHRDHRHD